MIKEFLLECNYDVENSTVKSFYQKRAKLVDFQGTKFFSCNNLLLSSYNKAEALQWWINERKIQPKRVIFVDDNSDNAFSVFVGISNVFKCSVHSYWYTPPAFGKDENASPEMRKYFLYIAQQKKTRIKKIN